MIITSFLLLVACIVQIGTWSRHSEKVNLLLLFGQHILSMDVKGNLYMWAFKEIEWNLSPVGHILLEENFSPSCIMHPDTYLNKVCLLLFLEFFFLIVYKKIIFFISNCYLLHLLWDYEEGQLTPDLCCLGPPLVEFTYFTCPICLGNGLNFTPTGVICTVVRTTLVIFHTWFINWFLSLMEWCLGQFPYKRWCSVWMGFDQAKETTWLNLVVSFYLHYPDCGIKSF